MMPVAKNKFQLSFFQSYLKKEMLPGKQAAQICFKVEEMPKGLLPNMRSKGTINPIKGPDIHHGQGARIHSKNDVISLAFEVKRAN